MSADSKTATYLTCSIQSRRRVRRTIAALNPAQLGCALQAGSAHPVERATREGHRSRDGISAWGDVKRRSHLAGEKLWKVTVRSLLACFLISSGHAVDATPTIELEGYATVNYLDRGESETLSFHTVVAGSKYRIRFHGYADGNIVFNDVVFDGETSVMLTKFRNQPLPDISDQKIYRTIEDAMKDSPGPAMNDSFAILRLGPVPPGPVEAIGVWLAFAAESFLESQPQQSIRKLFDPYSTLRKGPTNIASHRRLSMWSAAVPEFISNYHMHAGLRVTNEVFHVRSWTNGPHGYLPHSFTFSIFQTHEAPFGRPLTQVEYEVRSLRSTDQSDFTLHLSAVSVVNDERFWEGPVSIPGVQYVTQRGVVTPVNEVKASPIYSGTVAASGARRRTPWTLYAGSLLLLTLPAWALILRNPRRGAGRS
jgi:hypothetical protein